MALSNMRREPRRELTESGLGILAFGAFVAADFMVCRAIVPYYNVPYAPPWWVAIVALMILVGLLGPILFMGFLYLTHEVGEVVCGWMADLGYDPRPRNRH